MLAFVKGAKPEKYDSQRYYTTTKLFPAWWSAAMARRFGERISIFTVGPGLDVARQEVACTVLNELTGAGKSELLYDASIR